MSGRAGPVLLLAWAALGGCASEAEQSLLVSPDTPSSTAGPESDVPSNTPRITLGPTPEDAQSLLLSEDDVLVVDGFNGAAAADIGDLEIYENPDPRGPCGAPLDAQPTPDAGRGFPTEDGIVLQFVYLDAGVIEGYLEALAADLRPGCEPHESRTNIDTVQRVSAPVPIDTTGLGDRSLGWKSTITSAGVSSQAATVITITDQRASILLVFSDEIDAGQMVALAQTAAARADAAPP